MWQNIPCIQAQHGPSHRECSTISSKSDLKLCTPRMKIYTGDDWSVSPTCDPHLTRTKLTRMPSSVHVYRGPENCYSMRTTRRVPKPHEAGNSHQSYAPSVYGFAHCFPLATRSPWEALMHARAIWWNVKGRLDDPISVHDPMRASMTRSYAGINDTRFFWKTVTTSTQLKLTREMFAEK